MVRRLDARHANGQRQIIGSNQPDAAARQQISTSKADFVPHQRPHQQGQGQVQVGQEEAGYEDVPASVECRINQEKARHTFAEDARRGDGAQQQGPSGTTSQSSYVLHANDRESMLAYQRNRERGRHVDDWTKGFGEQKAPMQSSYATNYAAASAQRQLHDAAGPKAGNPHYNILTGQATRESGLRPANRVSYEKLRQVREAQNGPYNIISNMSSPVKVVALDGQAEH